MSTREDRFKLDSKGPGELRGDDISLGGEFFCKAGFFSLGEERAFPVIKLS